MGNLKIDKINNIRVDSGFYRNYGFLEGGDLTAQCNKTGMYRVFNAVSGHPNDSSSGNSDYYVESYTAEDNKWIRLQVYNVRNSNIWERMCINGKWGDWILQTNNEQVESMLESKVDKVNGKQLSDQNYTLPEKQKLANMTSHFRGVFATSAELSTITNPIKGDYAIVGTSPNVSIWIHNGTTFVDTNGKMFGDMMASVYSPTVSGDLADRKNHHGTQSMSTIANLQDTLNTKVNKVQGKNVVAVVDNYESESGEDALSARMGNDMRNRLLGILSGNDRIKFQGVFEENGYMYVGNLLVQWGVKDFEVGNDNKTLRLPFHVPYFSKPFVIMATPVSETTYGSGGDFASAKIIDNLEFFLVKDYATTSNATSVQWLSIGI